EWGGRGVKEKNTVVVAKDVVSPSVIDEPVVVEKQSSLVDTSILNVEKTGLSSYSPLPTQGSTAVGNKPVVPVESIKAISKRFAYTAYGFFLGKSSYARVMIELRADMKLKDTIVVAMPKIVGEGFYTCTIHVEPVFKKSTANISGNKKKGVEPTKEVSNSNTFDVLNSVVNDVELGTNGRTSNLASNEANSSGSSFWNVETSSTSTTLNIDKIGKLEKLIIDGKVTLVDDDPDKHNSEDEVESVDNDMARYMASEMVGFGTKSLLEQWSDSYENDDYDEDPYDDDMYEGQDLS
nr:hypothetical protein [Tanacetum cinerariifolium]